MGPKKKRPPPPLPAVLPRIAPRDATDVVPGGVPQSLASDALSAMYATDPFRKAPVAEQIATLQGGEGQPGDVAMARAFGRPASGAIPPTPVDVKNVPAAANMLDEVVDEQAKQFDHQIAERKKKMKGRR